MTLEKEPIKEIILRLLQGKDYRIIVLTLLDKIFLDYTVFFFKEVINAKLNNENITLDWYKKHFIENTNDYSPDEIAIHAGLNKKSITNSYNSGKAEIVLDASEEHYDNLKKSLDKLLEEDELEIS